jgi:hypothetical protein
MDAQIQLPDGTPMRGGMLRKLTDRYGTQATGYEEIPAYRRHPVEVAVICRPHGTLADCSAFLLPGTLYCARHQPGQQSE